MPVDRAATAKGALAGAVAATVWAAQQPLDQKVFGVDYDDCELLGRAVLPGRAGPAPIVAGWALHALNGAVFGAIYAQAAPRVPLPSWARGPAAGLLEGLATWPGTIALPHLHPDADRFPKLWGSARALGQATWRHVLFGTVLGEIERRLNAPVVEEVPSYEHVVSSNGHGNLEHAAVAISPVDDEDEE